MEQQSYHNSIATQEGADTVFNQIANVKGWWAKDFTGRALENGDTFIVRFGETSVDFQISDAIPGQKTVWKVTDCHLPWLKDQKEWNGTEVAWQLTPENGGTRIDMTHVGLVPGIECYDGCNSGWNKHFVSLLNLINDGVGQPS